MHGQEKHNYSNARAKRHLQNKLPKVQAKTTFDRTYKDLRRQGSQAGNRFQCDPKAAQRLKGTQYICSGDAKQTMCEAQRDACWFSLRSQRSNGGFSIPSFFYYHSCTCGLVHKAPLPLSPGEQPGKCQCDSQGGTREREERHWKQKKLSSERQECAGRLCRGPSRRLTWENMEVCVAAEGVAQQDRLTCSARLPHRCRGPQR